MRSAERGGNEGSDPREPSNCSSRGKEKKKEKGEKTEKADKTDRRDKTDRAEKDTRRKTPQCAGELCEILSSDGSNEQIEQDADNFIIVELISYIGGNSKIITYYPSTRGSKSGQNKYLHHFYSKKRIKLYLCLHKRSNEIYIYEVESRKVRRRETPPGSSANAAPVPEAISTNRGEMNQASAFLHGANVKSEPPCDAPPPPNDEHNPIINESTSSCKEEPTHECKPGKCKTKEEDKSTSMMSENQNFKERSNKKMVVTKLFDSVHCSYDLSTVEFTKLNSPDDKTLNSLKSILEQKINKSERRVSDAGHSQGGAPLEETSQKGDTQKRGNQTGDTQTGAHPIGSHIADTLSKGPPPSDHSCAKADEAGKDMTRSGDNDSASDSQVKILFLLFREPADIYMNQFAAFDQGSGETCTREISGFLKDEQQRLLERECAQAKRANNYGAQIKQTTHDQVPQSFLQSYESDVSIYSNDLFFSDSEVVTREEELNTNEKKNKRSFPVYTRSNLKIKWLLLNLNLTKEEEVVIEKYVLLKKASILRATKSTHDSNDLHSSFYKTEKKSNEEQRKSRRKESHWLKGDPTWSGRPYSTRSTRKGNSQARQQKKDRPDESDTNEAHHTQLATNDRDDNHQSENTLREKQKGEDNKLIFTFKFEEDAEKARQAGDLHHEQVSVEHKMSSHGGEINRGNQNDHATEADPSVHESDASVEPVFCYPSARTSKEKASLLDDASTCQEPSRASKVCSSYSYLDQGSQALCEAATDDNEEETLKGRKRKIDELGNANQVQCREKKMLHVLPEGEDYDDDFPEERNGEGVASEVGASNETSNEQSNDPTNDPSNDPSNDSLASGSAPNHSSNSNVSYTSEADCRYRRCADSVEEVPPREGGQPLQSGGQTGQQQTGQQQTGQQQTGQQQTGQQLPTRAGEAVNSSLTQQCDGFVDSSGGCSEGEGCLKGDAGRAERGEGGSGKDGERGSSRGGEETLFFKHKVRSLFDVIKVICCNFARHFKYSSKLKFYVTTFLNFSKIEKTKLQFMQKERILDTQLLKMHMHKKTEDVNNAWRINTHKMDRHNLFRLNKFKYIDDSIIDFFHNYIYSFVLKEGSKREGGKNEGISTDRGGKNEGIPTDRGGKNEGIPTDRGGQNEGRQNKGIPTDRGTQNDVYIFNTFFYKKIELYEDTCKAYLSTNRWIQKLDRKVYEYTYVFVPINISNTHWSLVLLYFPFNGGQAGREQRQEGEKEEEGEEEGEKKNSPVRSSPSGDSPMRSPSSGDSPKSDPPSGDSPESNPPTDHSHPTFRSKSCESFFSKRGAHSKSRLPKNRTALLRNYLQGRDNPGHHHERKEGHLYKDVKSSSDCGDDHHTGSIPPKGDMTIRLRGTNKTGSPQTCNDATSKVKDPPKKENVKVAYMIYLDSLFPSIKGNKILHKLKRYLEHMLQRDCASPGGVTTALGEVGAVGAAPSASANTAANTTANSSQNPSISHNPSSAPPPRIFFKFVYPNVIPKQTNTYDCGIYIIQFVLHLCLNKHLVESELIKSCREQGKGSPAADRLRFGLHNHRRDGGGSYSRPCAGKPAPWFSPKDVSLKRKQMKKMLLYMKSVVDWKSDRHVQALNLLFLKTHSMEGSRAKVEDSSR
ncbi:sentrin-specific protease 2, putative [Plasmodium vivax]|uniref:Sentrin-specific protease 2, putative n=1 Tax=Plasmodium vivax TaxID=5855 RepID=A0A1G4GR77_PLAVI|nr:sentrin-specific protease 2, putative [Plasmodium vivax]